MRCYELFYENKNLAKFIDLSRGFSEPHLPEEMSSSAAFPAPSSDL